MAKYLIVGNWKMNPRSPKEAKKILDVLRRRAPKYRRVETVVCLPHVYLSFAKGISSLTFGAQDVFYEAEGAYTGKVSPQMLKSMGIRYVIVGHSERRALGETDEVVNKKVRAALAAGLTPILCIGETSRDEHGQYLHRVKEMLRSALQGVSRASVHKVVVAYEPVWAVGKEALGVLNADEALHMNLFIRKAISDLGGEEALRRTRVLYGGSVDAENALNFLSIGKMDGLLVGRESLNPEKFLSIIESANVSH